MLIFLLLVSALLLVVGGIAWRRRRKSAELHGQDSAQLEMLHKIDRTILTNLPLAAAMQEIVTIIDEHSGTDGAAIRSVDQRTGDLTVLAVSPSLQTKDEDGQLLDLAVLKDRIVTPTQVMSCQSLTGHAINERRVITGKKLRDFECPLLDPEEADHWQQALQIGAIVVYPIVVEDTLSGAITFYFSRPLGSITTKDHTLMQMLADEVGVALVNTHLLSQLEDMNHRLEEANVHLQALDASKDEVISITSHQLRSPLTAVKGYLSMLVDGDFGKLAAKQSAVITQVEQSTSEVINVLNDMLSVSKINAEHFELTKTATNLEDLVMDVCTELKPLAQEKSLHLHVKLPTHPIGVVYLDPLRIRQVLVNFIDNAIKYTPKGLVTVQLDNNPDDIAVTVKDSGIGIPEAEISQMFKKYYRAHNARRMVTIGTGLGLFVVKRVIEDHHGEVIVRSEEGVGSTFGFRIPRHFLVQPDAVPGTPALTTA